MQRVVLAVLVVASAACSDRSSSKPATSGDAGSVTRVFERPRKGVKAVPPHAIRSEGVGPYLLGTSLRKLLTLTGRGPRVQLMELDKVVHYSLVWAENQSIVMGVERDVGLSYITVVDREIARTEKGAGVGVTTDELTAALGPRRHEPLHVRDPRVWVFDALPNVRFVVEDHRVTAVTVGLEGQPAPSADGERAAAAAPPPPPPPPPRCDRGESADGDAAVREAAKVDRDAQIAHGCMGDRPLVVINDGGRITALIGPLDKPRRVRVTTADGAVFADALDVSADGNDEVVVVTQTRSPNQLSLRVEIHRFDGTRFTRVQTREAYQVLSASVPWIGAELDDIELMLEIRAVDDEAFAGGLLVQSKRGKVFNSAPLEAVKIMSRARRPGEPADEEDADGGVAPASPGKPTRDAGVRDGGRVPKDAR